MSIFQKDDPPMPKERMLIGFDDNGQPYIMCRRGPGIECEDYGSSAEDIGVPVPARAEGLWVYDVTPRFSEDYEEGHPTGFGNLEYDGGVFRRPNAEEWVAIGAGNVKLLYDLWGQQGVVSRLQWDERLDKIEKEAKTPENLNERMDKVLKGAGARQLPSVHDEVVYEVPAGKAGEVLDKLEDDLKSTRVDIVPIPELEKK